MTVNGESANDERRGTARVPVGWSGQYVIPGRPELGWGRCQVVDVSRAGVGLELVGPWPDDAAEEVELLVRLEPGGTADPVQACGAVRHATSPNTGVLRVGIEFIGDAPNELVGILGSFRARGAEITSGRP
jgi:PilZ domain